MQHSSQQPLAQACGPTIGGALLFPDLCWRAGWQRLCIAAIALTIALFAVGLARAATPASPWAETEHGAVRLIAANDAVGTGDAVSLGLEFRMNPGWKIYWRSPGDAGYPPRIDWTGSHNLAEAAIAWPAPMRFSILGFETVGYEQHVILPIAARLIQAGDALALRASVDYLTCAEICVPHVADLSLDIPTGPATPSSFAAAVARFAAKVPGDGAASGLGFVAIEAVADSQKMQLRVVAQATERPFEADTDAFVEGPAGLAFGRPHRSLEDGGRIAILAIPVLADDPAAAQLTGQHVTVTLVSGDRTLETSRMVSAVIAAPGKTAVSAPASHSLAMVMLIALLGGLILNLMPCVLPVLSLKLLAVVSHGGAAGRQVRAGFLASAAGIVFSFMLLAGTLIALRSAGLAVGWGMQFQQPWFLVAMILLLIFFACNLWGLFEVPLPAVIAGLDLRAGHTKGLVGHFLTGALATLLATPCSAPFVGTAIGFALSRGSIEILAVFAALAIGLALPYLLVAAAPSLATRLPRPGHWMITVRRVLGLALAATAAWLLTILAGHISDMTVMIVGALALAIMALLFIGHRLPRPGRRVAAIGSVGLAIAAFVLPTFILPAASIERADRGGDTQGIWIPFDEARIPALIAEGKTVLVNVTADWCLTCKVNESLVLGREPVHGRLTDGKVVAMQADWTRPDPAIADYLAGFGRYGIPFDAVYGPAIPNGEALPELLTADIVVRALDQARAGHR